MDWIAVGLSQDLRKGMAMPARVAGIDLALWRAESGQVHIWGDRCPHRGMRLSHGFVRGETLACIYHGWQYGADGGCVAIPAHPKLTPPKSICATTYDCVESDGVIWLTLEKTDTSPPELSGKTPVRSLQVDASHRDTAAYFGDAMASLITVGETTLAVQPNDDASCTLHVLTTADAKAASNWVETQRTRIEGAAA